MVRRGKVVVLELVTNNWM